MMKDMSGGCCETGVLDGRDEDPAPCRPDPTVLLNVGAFAFLATRLNSSRRSAENGGRFCCARDWVFGKVFPVDSRIFVSNSGHS